MASSSVSQEETNDRENAHNVTKKTKIRSPRNNALKMQHDDVKSQSFPQTSDSPILNRTRCKTERDNKGQGFRAGSTPLTNSKLRMQRERRRTKRREAYMPSTEGTSTGEEDDNELFTLENQNSKLSSSRVGDETVSKAPPQAHAHFTRKLSASCRASKSPSDLDADDEDNQDYDSASVVSTSETIVTPQPFSNNDDAAIDNASFRAQFQEIRVAGMQQLAAVAAENDSSGLLSESSSANEDIAKVKLQNVLLEKEKREKSTLVQELAVKEQKIFEMEKIIKELSRRLREADLSNEKLKSENQALQQSLSKVKL